MSFSLQDFNMAQGYGTSGFLAFTQAQHEQDFAPQQQDEGAGFFDTIFGDKQTEGQT